MNGAGFLLGLVVFVAGLGLFVPTMLELGADLWQFAAVTCGVLLGVGGLALAQTALGGLSRRCNHCGSWHQND